MMKTVIFAVLIGATLPIAPATAQTAATCGLAPYQLRASRGDTPGIGCRRSDNDAAYAAQFKRQKASNVEKHSGKKLNIFQE